MFNSKLQEAPTSGCPGLDPIILAIDTVRNGDLMYARMFQESKVVKITKKNTMGQNLKHIIYSN